MVRQSGGAADLNPSPVCRALDMDLLYDINLQEMATEIIGDKPIKLGHDRLAKDSDQLHLLIAEPLLVNFFENQPCF
jgi:hypothetical protein